MSCETGWELEPHILYFKLSGKVTPEEYSATIDRTIALANSRPEAMVHTLIDACEVTQLPTVALLGREVRRVLTDSPNRGTSAVCGPSRVVRLMLEMLIKITSMRVQVFESRDEARQFLLDLAEHGQPPRWGTGPTR